MGELPPQSELDQRLPVRQEQIDDWLHCYQHISGQLAAYDRLVERGEPLSDIASDEIEDLLELQAYYKRMLDTGHSDES